VTRNTDHFAPTGARLLNPFAYEEKILAGRGAMARAAKSRGQAKACPRYAKLSKLLKHL
jgi:hypothetical protein